MYSSIGMRSADLLWHVDCMQRDQAKPSAKPGSVCNLLYASPCAQTLILSL
jgi:hypothetical protein